MKASGAIGLLFIVLAGGGAGAYVALTMRDGDPAPPPKSEPNETGNAPACGPASDPDPKSPPQPATKLMKVTVPGYYVANLRKDGIDIDFMTPTLLTPRAQETIPDHCPDRLVVVAGDDTHAKTIQPVLDALEPLALPSTDDEMMRKAAYHINELGKEFRRLAAGTMASPPMRILYKHYPRDQLEGHCVTLQLVIFSVPDSYFDKQSFRDLMRGRRHTGESIDIAGRMLEVRKTYQLEGGTPKLIEACIEAHTSVGIGVHRHPVGRLLGEGKTHPLLEDGEQTAHFLMYGGGVRWGAVWLDRSLGLGEPQPWSRVYRIEGTSMREPAKVRMGDLPAAVVPVLQEVVQRS